MTKKIIMAAIVMLIALFFVGIASAAPDIQVLPDTGGETINVPADGVTDAYASIGLEVNWTGWTGCSVTAPCTYLAQILDENDDVVWEASGTKISGPFWIETVDEWVPSTDLTKSYMLYANGNFKRYLKTVEQPIGPIPELSTSILTATGLIGLVGLVRMRRKGGV